MEEIKKADLITIGIGNLDYLTNTLVDYYETDWEQLLGEKGAAYALKALVELYAGLGTMAESVGPILESYLYSCVGYAMNYTEVLNTIHAINPSAQVIVVGAYNPFEGLVFEDINVGKYFGAVIDFSNVYLTGYAMAVPNTIFVAAPDVELLAAPSGDYMGYVLALMGGNLYPSDNGHEYIKDQILKAVTVETAKADDDDDDKKDDDDTDEPIVTPDQPEEEKPGTGDSEVKYEGPYTASVKKMIRRFTGKKITPKVTVTDKNGNVVPASMYTVKYSKNKWVGTAKVTVTMKDTKETATTTFRIRKAKAKSLKVKNIVYSGKKATKKNIKIYTSAGVRVKKRWIKKITIKQSRKNVGTFKVTVKFKGKQIKNVKYTYKVKIVPKSTKINKVTAARKKLTITWKKRTTQVTGYQIQVSTSKKFTKNKKITTTVKVKKATTTKTTIKNLKKNKKYYVRIRTYKKVGKKTYYSAWSKVKTKKTK